MFNDYSNGEALFMERTPRMLNQKDFIKSIEGKGKIFFDEGTAIVKTMFTTTTDVEEIRNGGFINRENLYKYNFSSIISVLDSIYKINEKQKSAKIRIELVGHSSDKKIDLAISRYSSNYELSQARVQQVHLMLIDSLAQREKNPSHNNLKVFYNVEWLLVPLSNEDKFSDPQPTDEIEKRCVDISFQRLDQYTVIFPGGREEVGQKMKFLDYMYFMIYTITTTGYGDIKPVGGFIKLIVSLANIYEVFFTVLFFSAILSAPLSNLLDNLKPPSRTIKKTK